MSVIVRFAPSPTGLLHIGNLRTALFNALLARREGGRFVLRLDDTDRERSRAEYAEAIERDLAWIGIAPDRVIRQSDRIERYDAAADRLRSAGLLYPCYETPDELDRKRKRLIARGCPPVYGREALDLSATDRERLEAEGRWPHWRFLLPNHDGDPKAPRRAPVAWTDRVHGEQTVDLGSLSDPVLIRADGSYLYTLPSVVDDGAEGVTDILRGDDHVTNTGVQIAIFQALALPVPRFGHHNLLTTGDGEGLSKRSGALALRTLREDGYEPMAVASLAMLLGMAGSVDAVPDLDALAARLDLGAVSSSPSRFDPGDLDRLNADLVHAKPAEQVSADLDAAGVPQGDRAAFWTAVRGNCTKVADAAGWANVVYGAVTPPDLAADDAAFVGAAARALPEGAFDAGTWKIWTATLKTKTGRKGKALFMPLRRALTGLDHGPELAGLLPLIGRERAETRLARASASAGE